MPFWALIGAIVLVAAGMMVASAMGGGNLHPRVRSTSSAIASTNASTVSHRTSSRASSYNLSARPRRSSPS